MRPQELKLPPLLRMLVTKPQRNMRGCWRNSRLSRRQQRINAGRTQSQWACGFLQRPRPHRRRRCARHAGSLGGGSQLARSVTMRPWQRLWLVLTILWGIPWALMLAKSAPGVPDDPATYLMALGFVVGAPSAAVYLLLWAVAGFFPVR